MSQSISQVPLVEAPAELRTAGHLNEILYNLGGVATISFAFRVHKGDGHKTLEANLEEEIWQKLRMNWQGKTWPNSLQASMHAHCATRCVSKSAVISCHMLQTPSVSKEEGAMETNKMTVKFGCSMVPNSWSKLGGNAKSGVLDGANLNTGVGEAYKELSVQSTSVWVYCGIGPKMQKIMLPCQKTIWGIRCTGPSSNTRAKEHRCSWFVASRYTNVYIRCTGAGFAVNKSGNLSTMLNTQ